MIVKICGLMEAVTLDAALDGGADMVGFVFFAPSPRNLTAAQARELAARVEGRAQIVALTVNVGDADLAAIVEAVGPDLLQLHGDESPDRVGEVRARFGRPVVKVVGVASAEDLGRLAEWEQASDWFLFDARAPSGAGRPGGNGQRFDWALLRGLATRRPWLLAGGLDETNVGAAARASGAHGVDVSSGVERAPGVKDAGKIGRFLAASRAAQASPAA